MKHLLKKMSNLGMYEKLAVYSGLILIVLFILVIFKQGTFSLGLTGASGALMPYLHHSRWGALMIIVGIGMVFRKPTKIVKEVGLILIMLGLFLVVHHLATEQCFALLTTDGLPAGGLC